MPKTKLTEALEDNQEGTSPVEIKKNKVGHFIVLNTPTVKGVRINLEKVKSYSPNEEAIQFAFDDGIQSVYKFGNTEEMYKVLELIDSQCI